MQEKFKNRLLILMFLVASIKAIVPGLPSTAEAILWIGELFSLASREDERIFFALTTVGLMYVIVTRRRHPVT